MIVNYKTAQVGTELDHFPRGERGSAQNVFRSVYQMARMNSMGKRAQLPNDAVTVRQFAIGMVRREFPGFELVEI